MRKDRESMRKRRERPKMIQNNRYSTTNTKHNQLTQSKIPPLKKGEIASGHQGAFMPSILLLKFLVVLFPSPCILVISFRLSCILLSLSSSCLCFSWHGSEGSLLETRAAAGYGRGRERGRGWRRFSQGGNHKDESSYESSGSRHTRKTCPVVIAASKGAVHAQVTPLLLCEGGPLPLARGKRGNDIRRGGGSRVVLRRPKGRASHKSEPKPTMHHM